MGQSDRNSSPLSAGDKERSRTGIGKETGNKPKSTAEKLRDAAALNAAGTAASHAVKMSLLMKLKMKLQMLAQHAVQ